MLVEWSNNKKKPVVRIEFSQWSVVFLCIVFLNTINEWHRMKTNYTRTILVTVEIFFSFRPFSLGDQGGSSPGDRTLKGLGVDTFSPPINLFLFSDILLVFHGPLFWPDPIHSFASFIVFSLWPFGNLLFSTQQWFSEVMHHFSTSWDCFWNLFIHLNMAIFCLFFPPLFQ